MSGPLAVMISAATSVLINRRDNKWSRTQKAPIRLFVFESHSIFFEVGQRSH